MSYKNILTQTYKLTDEQLVGFDQLFRAFIKTNQTLNLSAIREEEAIWEKHFLDSLLATEFLFSSSQVIDLGSGGGFPLLVLALYFPNKSFVGVESVGKKVKAMEHFIEVLHLKNVKIQNQRVETLGRHKSFREQFDTVTARAFAKFPALLEMALPLLKRGGHLVAFRGPDHDKTDFELIKLLGGRLLTQAQKELPSGDKREFWIIEKIKPTSNQFPRQVGMPKKIPLRPENF